MHSWLVRENPAWTNAALQRQWNAIERHVGKSRMPKLTQRSAKKIIAVEYGSGLYGTVMPTGKPGLVVKITSDPTEAKVAFILKTLPRYPAGIVKYHGVFRLQSVHEHRPVFILWREEAYDVGSSIADDSPALEQLFQIKEMVTPALLLTSYQDGDQHRESIVSAVQRFKGRTGYENHGSGPGILRKAQLYLFGSIDERAGFEIDGARAIADDMAHEREAPLLGAAIRDLMDQGIVLADIHDGNVGLARRKGRMEVVITDPGNTVFLTTKYEGVRVPELEKASSRAPRSTHGSQEIVRSQRSGMVTRPMRLGQARRAR